MCWPRWRGWSNWTWLATGWSNIQHQSGLSQTVGQLSPNRQLTFKHYTACHNFSNNISDTRPSGGVTILVHNGVPNSSVPLTTTLQAQAITVTFNQTITICSIIIYPTKLYYKSSPNWKFDKTTTCSLIRMYYLETLMLIIPYGVVLLN